MSCRVILRGISLPYKESEETALREAEKRLKAQRLSPLSLGICKKSVDARKRGDIRFVYSVTAEIGPLPDARVLSALNAQIADRPVAAPLPGSEKPEGRVIVVGFGPAGIFAALALARAGYRPVVLERGDGIAERQKAVARFLETGELDCESNVQFGAGGAGSFSDGKLITRVNDPLSGYVLQTLYEAGAPQNILTRAKPHVGTDKLCTVVSNIEKEIIRCGGEIHFRTKLLSFVSSSDGKIRSVRTTNGEIRCGALILAIGHSARDTFRMLSRSGCLLVPKDFSVGARIEHLQEDIDRALYGDADLSVLGHAEYALSMREGDRGVYSFCMCPGGEVICASTEQDGLVVNGMSRYARDGKNANAAIAVSVLKKDYGEDPFKAIDFQERIEKAAFAAAGGGFRAPIQTVGDFLSGKKGSEPTVVQPSFRKGACTPASLEKILPDFVVGLMKKGLPFFDRQIPGFAASHALLTGVETRTSSPLRILRSEDLTSHGHGNLYPCGEGAGYAGGITSAAIDGTRAAFAVISRFSNV